MKPELIKIAQTHVERIQLALQKTQHLFPLDQTSITQLNENDLVWLEFLISRFGKLQDLLGTKLIDAYLLAQQENIEQLSMLDKLHKLERLGIIEDSELWKKMRNARNHISHEYPDHPELTAKYLNQIFELAPELLQIFKKLMLASRP